MEGGLPQSDIGGEFNGGSPTQPPGRDKSGPYALGIASLAVYGHFATYIKVCALAGCRERGRGVGSRPE